MARVCMLEPAGIGKVAFRRNSWPMGGRFADVVPFVVRWRAGHTYSLRILLLSMVKRSACRISPVLASLANSRRGKIGKPAASAELQSAGRRAFERRSKVDEPKMSQPPDVLG